MIDAIDAPGPLWFPGLAAKLASRFDAQTGAPAKESYRTSSWLGHADPLHSQCRRIAIGDRTAILEDLADMDMPDLSIVPVPWRKGDANQLRAALTLLDRVDGLTATLAPLVRALHRVNAEPEYDISHSEPNLPYSIWVSIPPTGATAAVRLAESILHEAMHLQLSLIETGQPLVADAGQRAWSPWQAKQRPAQGLLHGLYVFAVIFEVLEELDRVAPSITTGEGRPEAAMCSHFEARRRQIEEDISALPDFSAALEPAGKLLWRRCLDVLLVRI